MRLRAERPAEEAGLGLRISPGACKLLREQLVEVITCVRSQGAVAEAEAGASDSVEGQADLAASLEPARRPWAGADVHLGLEASTVKIADSQNGINRPASSI